MMSKICATPVFRTNFQNPSSQASGLNYNYATPLNESKPNFLQRDTFKSQKKFNPAFGDAILQKGIIPAEGILDLCTNLKSIMDDNCISSSESLRELARGFFKDINELTPCDKEIPQAKQIIFGCFQNLLKNIITTARTKISSALLNDIDDLRSELGKALQIIEEDTKKWAAFEEDVENNNNITIERIVGFLKPPSKDPLPDITLKGKELLDNTTIEDPNATILSLVKIFQFMEPFGKKDFTIKIEQVMNDDIAPFHAVFYDPAANPLPRDIVNRVFYRKEDHPYREFVELLQDHGYEPADLVENVNDHLGFRLPLIEVSKNSP